MNRRGFLTAAAAVCVGINRPAKHIGETFVSHVRARPGDSFHRCTFEAGVTNAPGVVIRNCVIYVTATHGIHEAEKALETAS